MPIAITAADDATSFQAPGRVCIYAEVEPALKTLVSGRDFVELRSIHNPSALMSQLEQDVKASLYLSHVLSHENRGAGLIRTYGNEWLAKSSCSLIADAAYAKIFVSLNSSHSAYRITITIFQGDKLISEKIERDAIPQLEKHYKNMDHYNHNSGPIPLIAGIGWSMEGDVRDVTINLLKRVEWRKP